ncbi:phage minor capsid protein [Paludifilum halophilum]|uniref:Minor capsid protein n=1 Tax=Paludifilum halophilum TaxID=1642702 RepID=A0A235B9H1_9BACL|nr:phage minor capsid protein [Paludifilum halophilum]OYD08537.1 minor capsid protein [Paludifilum halophilum]
MRTAPEPTYEHDVETLARLYKQAVRNILAELERIDLMDPSRPFVQTRLREIARILAELNEASAAWVEENVPKAAQDGVESALYELGIAETMEQAATMAQLNQVNAEVVAAAVADTQEDLLAVTRNIDRRVRLAVQQVTSEVMRANMTEGINGRKTITGDMMRALRKRLGDAVNTGIIDAAGRRWRPEVYVDLVARTKLNDIHLEARANEAIANDSPYGIISSHGAKDACRFHENRIVKLVASAPGPYPTISELRATNQIWHPNCKHTVHVLRDPSLLPDDLQRTAERQAARSNAAIQTGKRNPSEDELET